MEPSAAVLGFVLMIFPLFQRRVPSHPQSFWLTAFPLFFG
jgi:hypothetical protein